MRYRDDESTREKNGAVSWWTRWMGGPTLSKVENCPTDLVGDPLVTAIVTGEADTYFSIPAIASYRGVKMRGYITTNDEGFIFRHCYY